MNSLSSDVRTICTRAARSAVAPLLANGTTGQRYILGCGDVMIHAGTHTFTTSLETQDLASRQAEYRGELHLRLDKIIDKVVGDLQRSNQTYVKLLSPLVDLDQQQLTEICVVGEGGDYRLTPEQAQAAGFVDYVVDSLAEIPDLIPDDYLQQL